LILCIVFFGCSHDSDGGFGIGGLGGLGGLGGGGLEDEEGVDTVVGDAVYSAGDYLPLIMGYEWNYGDENGDFVYTFTPEGVISVPGCCCAGGGSYFLNGNVLVSWFDSGMYEGIQVTNFTIADDNKSFTRNTGEKYIRSKALASPAKALKFSNALLGTWRGDDGKNYVFGSDASLKIDSVQYGYFVRNSKLVMFGPLVEGKTVAVSQVYKIGVLATKTKLAYNDENGKEKYITLFPVK